MYTLRPPHFLPPLFIRFHTSPSLSLNHVSFSRAFKIIPRSIYFNRANKIQKYLSLSAFQRRKVFRLLPDKIITFLFSSSYVAFQRFPFATLLIRMIFQTFSYGNFSKKHTIPFHALYSFFSVFDFYNKIPRLTQPIQIQRFLM